MTDESAPYADSPRELLTAVRNLTRRVRSAQRHTWFPLLVFAVIMLTAIPVYRYAPIHRGQCRSGPDGTSVCAAVIPLVLAYWPVMLVLAYAAIASFYVRQSRRQGIGTRIRPYVVVGVILAVLLAGASLWRASHPVLPSLAARLASARAPEWAFGFLTPAVAIGLALLVLAWVERSRALLSYSLGYLLVVLLLANPIMHAPSRWYFLPQLLLPAGLLVLGSAAFALARYAGGRAPR